MIIELLDWYLKSDIMIMHNDILNYKSIVRKLIPIDVRHFARAQYHIRDNKEIAMIAVKKDGLVLKSVSMRLKADKELVLEAVKNNPESIKFARYALRCDSEVVLVAVQLNGLTLRHACGDSKNNREIVIAAVHQNCKSLQYANDAFKNDKNIVLKAVSKDAMVLEYASINLKNDKYIVMIAVKKNGMALQFASVELKLDTDVVIEAINNNSHALQFAHPKVKEDYGIAFKAFNNLYSIGREFDTYADMINFVISQDGTALKFAPEEMKSDKKLVLSTIHNNPDALLYSDFCDDKDVVMEAVKRRGSTIKYASKKLQLDYDVAVEAVLNDVSVIGLLHKSFRYHPDFVDMIKH